MSCIICPRSAEFSCSKCRKALYCCKEHQISHWKSKHHTECYKKKEIDENLLENLLKKRYLCRRQFYENYCTETYDMCLLDCKAMLGIDKTIKEMTDDMHDELEYAASICLFVRICILSNEKEHARIVLNNFLTEADNFLIDMRMIPKQNEELTKNQKEFFCKKMNLLSTISNLCYVLETNCLDYYTLYILHFEKCFGKDSIETSNCYFLFGCYFAEEGHLKKSILFFFKAAACRGEQTGDCYFNIGILYALQKNNSKALEMFRLAYKFSEQQYGDDSKQLAEISENMGMIYTELNDFKTAMEEYDKSLLIRKGINCYSDEYEKTIELIQDLYEKLCLYINEGESTKGIKPVIFLNLKSDMEAKEIYWRSGRNKREMIINEIAFTATSKALEFVEEEYHGETSEKYQLHVSQGLLSKLNSEEVYSLSDLQMELNTLQSGFSRSYVIGKSSFYERMSLENFKLFVKENEKLCKLIRLERISNRVIEW